MDEKRKILDAKTPYDALLLSTTATPEEAKYQYFKLVKRYSPEREEETFRKIRKAYEVVKDPAKKAAADVMLFVSPPGRVRFAGVNTSSSSQVKLNRELEVFEDLSKTDSAAKTKVVDVLKQRAVLLAKNKKWEDAVADLDRLEELGENSEELRENRIYLISRMALDRARRAQYADASLRWRRALRLDPNRSYILHNLAVCSSLLSNREDEDRFWVDTLRSWHRELSDRGDDAYLKNLIVETHKHFGGRYLHQAGDDGLKSQVQAVEAERGFHAFGAGGAPQAAPGSTASPPGPKKKGAPAPAAPQLQLTGYAGAGVEAYQSRNWQGAVSNFELHLKENPDDAPVLDKLAWAYLRAGQGNRAFALWQKMIAEGPGRELAKTSFSVSKLETARTLRSRGMLNPALVQLKDLLKVVPDSTDVYKELGEIYEQRQDWGNTLFYFEKALELNPNDKALRLRTRQIKSRSRSVRAVR